MKHQRWNAATMKQENKNHRELTWVAYKHKQSIWADIFRERFLSNEHIHSDMRRKHINCCNCTIFLTLISIKSE